MSSDCQIILAECKSDGFATRCIYLRLTDILTMTPKTLAIIRNTLLYLS